MDTSKRVTSHFEGVKMPERHTKNGQTAPWQPLTTAQTTATIRESQKYERDITVEKK